MPRKVVKGPIRNKEKTKKKLLNAVGKIIKNKGYHALMVSKIAEEAGCDKKLIYEYFGNTENLITEYVKSQDYWSNIEVDEVTKEVSQNGIDICKYTLLDQFQILKDNKELQKIIIWELSENKNFLTNLNQRREDLAEKIFANYTDEYFGDKAANFRAITALLAGGIYYLSLFTGYNGTQFCGINLKTNEGRKLIENAISEVLDSAYQKNRKIT